MRMAFRTNADGGGYIDLGWYDTNGDMLAQDQGIEFQLRLDSESLIYTQWHRLPPCIYSFFLRARPEKLCRATSIFPIIRHVLYRWYTSIYES